jgi:hypothetical protein
MTTNQLMTAGAIGFAAFAVWWISRTPGQQVAAQPAQQQRDAGLAAWVATLDSQAREIESTSNALSLAQVKELLTTTGDFARMDRKSS